MKQVLTKDRAIMLNILIGALVIVLAAILQIVSLTKDEHTQQSQLKSVGQELTSRATERIDNQFQQTLTDSQLIAKYLSMMLSNDNDMSSPQLFEELSKESDIFMSISGVSVKGIETADGELILIDSTDQQWQAILTLFDNLAERHETNKQGLIWTIGISETQPVPRIYTSVALTINEQYHGRAILAFPIEVPQDSFNLLNPSQVFLVNKSGIGFLLEQPERNIYQLVYEDGSDVTQSIPDINLIKIAVTKNDSAGLDTWTLSQFQEANYYRMVTLLEDVGWHLNVFLDTRDYQRKLEEDIEEAIFLVGFLLVIFLISDRFVRYHYKVHELSITDPLTGLFNRMQFNRTSREFLLLHDRDKVTEIGVLSLDIDKFKLVNDNYGHSVGDEVLVILAKIMRQNSRRSDYLFRMGGEEFLIFSVGESLEGLVKFAERLRVAVEINPEVKEHLPNGFTVSIGVVSRAKEENINTLLERADALLYQAKENGRNRVEYIPPMD